MGRKKAFTPEQMKGAIVKADGVVTHAAKLLGCDPATVLNYAKEYEDVRETLEEARQRVTDDAEAVIAATIRSTDPEDKDRAIASSKWWLSRMGRDRGFGDSQDVNIRQQKTSITLDFVVQERDRETGQLVTVGGLEGAE